MRSLITALVLLLSTTAHAQAPDSDEERSRNHYAAGKEYYENGQYEKAITEFQAAYSIKPVPELSYNLYLAYERIARFDTALEHLDAYLSQAELAADERSQLETRRDALRARLQTEPPKGGGRDDHPERGSFLLRLFLGVGFADAENDAWKVYGGSGNFAFVIGFNPLERLALHATVWGASMVGAKLEAKGGLPITINDNETRYSAGAVGAGVTWYFPGRFYIGGSLGAGTVSAERDNTRSESQVGPAFLFMGGKDWSIGGGFRAGLGATVSLLAIPEKTTMGDTTNDATSTVVLLALMGTISFD